MRLERGQDDSKVLVLDKCLRVLAAAPPGLAMELLQLPFQIEFEIRGRHRLRVRSPVLCVFIGRAWHRYPLLVPNDGSRGLREHDFVRAPRTGVWTSHYHPDSDASGLSLSRHQRLPLSP